MALASITAAQTQYGDNIGYRSSGSASMALLFAEACEYLIGMRASSSSQEGRSMQFDTANLRLQAQQATAYATSMTSGGSVRHFDFNLGYGR
jgi:hypothetical protein